MAIEVDFIMSVCQQAKNGSNWPNQLIILLLYEDYLFHIQYLKPVIGFKRPAAAGFDYVRITYFIGIYIFKISFLIGPHLRSTATPKMVTLVSDKCLTAICTWHLSDTNMPSTCVRHITWHVDYFIITFLFLTRLRHL